MQTISHDTVTIEFMGEDRAFEVCGAYYPPVAWTHDEEGEDESFELTELYIVEELNLIEVSGMLEIPSVNDYIIAALKEKRCK